MNMLIMLMVCSIAKLKRPIPPKAWCIVLHSLLTFLFTPRNKREWKFSRRSTRCAAVRGIASVTRPYCIPGQSLNLYAIHPSLAGRCPLRILLIHEPTLPVTFSLRCLSSLSLTVDQCFQRPCIILLCIHPCLAMRSLRSSWAIIPA
jgi:hypothetical protein